MGYSNGIITAPVSIYDVQRAIGASSPDLGTLCKHANINKWARFKPIKASGVTPLEERTWSEGFFQGSRAYGIEGLFYSGMSIANFITAMYGVLFNESNAYYPSGYKYHMPEGTINSAYRLSDWALKRNVNLGYKHDAELMFSFKDTNSNWHSLQPFLQVFDGEGEKQRVAFPDDYAVIEPASNISDCWDNYNHDQAVSTMSPPWDFNMLVQDILYALHPNISSLKSLKHGILFIPYGTTEPSYCRMVISSFPEKTVTQAQLDPSQEWGYVEFYTNMSGSGFVPTSASGTYTFLPVPCCYGLVQFFNSSSSGGRFVILSSTAVWINGVYDMGATVSVEDMSYWSAVYLRVGEFDDTSGSGVQITTNNTFYDVSQYVSGNNGDTRWLKLVGIRNGESVKLYSESFTLQGGPTS